MEPSFENEKTLSLAVEYINNNISDYNGNSILHFTRMENAFKILRGRNLRAFNVESMKDDFDARMHIGHLLVVMEQYFKENDLWKDVEEVSSSNILLEKEFMKLHREGRGVLVGVEFSVFVKNFYVFVKYMMAYSAEYPESFSTYVTSFTLSDNSDYHDQWVEYGQNYRGVMIEFNRNALLKDIGKSLKINSDAIKIPVCLYKTDLEVYDLMKDFFSYIENKIFREFHPEREFMYNEVVKLKAVIDIIGAAIKRESYVREKECRIAVNNVSYGFSPLRLKSGSKMRFYHEMNFEIGSIERIQIGSKVSSGKREYFIRQMIKCGYPMSLFEN